MTLGEAKRKVLMILDEYSSGGSITADQDIMNKMNDFFDMGQKDVNNIKPIIRATTISLNGGFVALPGDFKEQFRIWKDGKVTDGYPIIGGKLYSENTGDVILEYFAVPDTIDMNTPDTYNFEVAEDAANCLPYYVAAQQLITDLVVDYGAIWNMYLYHAQQIDKTLPSAGTSGGRVRQTLFGGGR